MEYEERAALRSYVLKNLSAHLTDGERSRIQAEGIRLKQEVKDWFAERSRRIRNGEPELPWRPPRPSVAHIEFLEGVVERILRDLPSGISINRCPECRRVLRTPEAKLCLWCGHSQYGPGRDIG